VSPISQFKHKNSNQLILLQLIINITQAFKTKEQLVTHNCEQSNETKKHTSSQLPKKASGSFKPRKPTPKRQTLSKTAIPLADKEKLEKLKTDEMERKVIYILQLDHSFYFYFFIAFQSPIVLFSHLKIVNILFRLIFFFKSYVFFFSVF